MRAPKKSSPEPTAKVRHYIVDKDATEIAGIRVRNEHLKNGIELTPGEALSYIASGTLTTTSPEDEKQAAKAVAEKSEKAVAQAGGSTAGAGNGDSKPSKS